MQKNQHHICLPREEALNRIAAACHFEPKTEIVSLLHALNRVCAEDLRSVNTLPGKLTSRLDGIAVYYKDFAQGGPDTSLWQAGSQYVFANTGIAIAGDYDTVIKIEAVEIDETGKLVILKGPKEKGENTQKIGERMRTGDLLVRAHELLTPVHLSILAMGGVNQVKVLKKPVVAIIPTGNELVSREVSLPIGKNVESNGILIQSKAILWGAEPLLYGIVPDDPALLVRTVKDALSKADIVVLNAGSSKGTDDFTIEVLEQVGTILAHEAEHGPGRHTSFTIAGGKPIIGIVGPPIGADYTVDFYVLPLINQFLFLPTVEQQKLLVKLTDAVVSKGSSDFYVRIIVKWTEEGYLGIPAMGRGRPAVEGMVQANAHLRIPKGVAGYEQGDKVEVELRRPLEFIMAESEIID